MTTEADYKALISRLEELRQKRAVLISREEDKAAERKILEVQLTELGVDITKPSEELERLEIEIQADYRRQEELVTQFQKALEDKPAPTPANTPPRPSLEAPLAPVPADTIDLP